MSVNNLSSLYGTGGGGSGVNVGAGISGDMLQSWAMLGANTKAYKKLVKEQQQQANGNSSSYSNPNFLNSDKLFNDFFDNKTGKVIPATYKPTTASVPELDEESTSGDHLQNMRALALAAASKPGGLNQYQNDMFQQYYKHIASNLVTGSESDANKVETEAAQAANVEVKDLFRYLEDAQSFTLAGEKGEKTYSFGIGTSIEDMAAAINADSSSTGVLAEAVKNKDGTYTLSVSSVGTGKEAFVRIDQTQGDLFAAQGSSKSAVGKDAVVSDAKEEVTGADTQAAIAAGLYKGKLFEDVSFSLQGAKGKQTFKFEKGATADDIVKSINEATEKTGVKAEIIYNATTGEAEGIGLLADKRGVGNYIQATMHEGSLFGTEGRTVSVAGSSKGSESSKGAPAINNLQDLGQVTIDGVTYSFADLAQGGKASLDKNPDAALAVLDQAIKEIYSGLAEVKGFDPKDTYIPGVTNTSGGASASNNTLEFDNYGSQAMTDWLKKYKPDTSNKK